MRVRVGLLVCVAAALLASGSAAAQGPPVLAPEPVAQVGAVPIAKADYDHWLGEAAHAHFRRPVELLPPEYDQCVTVKRRHRAVKRWRPLGPAELRRRCRLDHHMLHRTVLQFLIQAQWVQQEAAARGVFVTEQRVQRAFAREKHAAFPNERAYRRFLRENGADETDIKFRVRLDILQNRLTRHVTAHAEPVTDDDVASYRADHPDQHKGIGEERARRKIRRQLESAREQLTLGLFIEDFRRRYRAMTWCGDGYTIAECGALAPPW